MQKRNRLLESLILSNTPEDEKISGQADTSTNRPIPIQVHPDLLDNTIKILTTAFTFIAIFIAVMEYRESNNQRLRELRFQQAQLGKELLDEVLDDEEAWDAMLILEYQDVGREFQVNAGITETIKTDDIIEALDFDDSTPSEQDKFIQRRMDALLFFIGRIQSSINIGMIKEEDVLYPLEYYALQMCSYRNNINTYMRKYPSKEAQTFLNNRWHNCTQANK